MSDLFNKLKRGGKEMSQESSRSGNGGSPAGSYSNRKDKGSRVSQASSRDDNRSSVNSKFYTRANKTEISVDVDKGDGYSKKG